MAIGARPTRMLLRVWKSVILGRLERSRERLVVEDSTLTTKSWANLTDVDGLDLEMLCPKHVQGSFCSEGSR